jgi:putative glutamine transport system substrate-binding protein
MKKRSIGLLLSVLLSVSLFGLTACGQTQPTSTTPAATASPAGTQAGTTPEPTKAADKGALKVGVKNNVVGFGYQDPLTNEYAGMEIDLANLIAEALGYDGVEFTAVTAATRTELLDAGTLDCVIATFTITDERKKSWDFSTPYYTDAVTVLVEKDSGITKLADLVGKKVGVSTSSTSAKALAVALASANLIKSFDTSADFVPSTFNGGVTFTEFADYPSISSALTAGTVDAFCVDKSILATYASEDRTYIEESFSPQNYGVATKKDAELSGQIEELITKWLSDGTIAGLVSEYGLD